MKKISLLLATLLFMGAMVGCGDKASNENATDNSSKTTTEATSDNSTKTSDLTGNWKQSNSESEDSYQEAVISGDTIEIYWISKGGDSKSLYWAGSYVAPSEAVDSYSWDSANDHEKTGSSLLASSDDTKKITYEKGELSYSASAMGTTTTIRLKKVDK